MLAIKKITKSNQIGKVIKSYTSAYSDPYRNARVNRVIDYIEKNSIRPQ